MARRNPLEEMKKRYFQNLKISKVHPWLFYHSCIKCGDEFCRELMYECIEPSIYFSEHYYYRGCTHCFSSVENFRKYLEDNGKICVENDFVNYNEKLMRELTPEENKSISNYLDKISKPLGINIADEKTVLERLIELTECIDKEIDAEMEKLPISKEDAIRKNAYCYGLQKVKYSIDNIIEGRDFNEFQ